MASSSGALESIVAALARRDLTEVELERKLARAGFPDEERAAALARARAAGYIDDSRVALERARRLAERGASNTLISFELRRRGVADEELEIVLTELDDESDRAATFAARAGGGARAARALARKGFPQEIVDRVIRREIADEP